MNVGIKISSLLSRTIYLEFPDDTPEEEIIEKAKKEITLPIDAMNKVDSTLQAMRIKIDRLELRDWEHIHTEYELLK